MSTTKVTCCMTTVIRITSSDQTTPVEKKGIMALSLVSYKKKNYVGFKPPSSIHLNCVYIAWNILEAVKIIIKFSWASLPVWHTLDPSTP